MAAKRTVSTGTVWEDIAGYSRAVRVGDRILVSGTTAADESGVVGPGDPSAQVHFIVGKIAAAIEQLGGSLEDVVRTRVYVSDMQNWEAVAKAHGERFGSIRPVNTLVQAKLVGEEYLVEIEVEAIVGAGHAI